MSDDVNAKKQRRIKKESHRRRRARHRSKWARIWQDNFADILSFAKRHAGDDDLGNELVGNVSLKLFRTLPNPYKIKDKLSYVRRAIRHAKIDDFKRKGRTARAETVRFDDVNDDAARELRAKVRDPSIEIENAEYVRLLATEVKRLSERERRIIRLHLLGFNCEEIAVQMGAAASTIRVALNVIRTRIRRRLIRKIEQGRRRGAKD